MAPISRSTWTKSVVEGGFPSSCRSYLLTNAYPHWLLSTAFHMGLQLASKFKYCKSTRPGLYYGHRIFLCFDMPERLSVLTQRYIQLSLPDHTGHIWKRRMCSPNLLPFTLNIVSDREQLSPQSFEHNTLTVDRSIHLFFHNMPR